MFKEQYKKTYDKIHGDKTQIAKIIALANNNDASVKRKPFFSFRYGTVFAAILVVCVSVYSFPQLRDSTKPINENKTVVNETKKFVPDENVSFQPSKVEKDDSINQPEQANKERNNKKSANDVQQESEAIVNSSVQKNDNVAKAKFENESTVVENAITEPLLASEVAVPQPASAYDMDAAQVPAMMAEIEIDSVDENAISAATPRNEGGVSYGGAPARAISAPVSEQYTKPFEGDAYATVTVYPENEQIAEVFESSESIMLGDAEVVVVYSGEIQKIYVKTDGSYAEIDAYNVSDENLKTTIEEISEM